MGEDHELSLAAGELREATRAEAGNAEPRQYHVGILGYRLATPTVGAHLHNLAHREIKVQVEVLRHERHLARHLAAPIRARRPAVDEDFAALWAQHSIDQVEQRALAAAVGTDDADEVLCGYVERHTPKHLTRVVGEPEVAYRDDGGTHYERPRRSR